jgi:hypothetical protein
MLIKVLRQTMLAGQVVRIGDVIEASPSDARLIIGIGKAIQVANVAATIVQAVEPEPLPKPQSPRRRAKP